MAWKPRLRHLRSASAHVLRALKGLADPVTAISSAGLLIIAIYIPFFSDLPNALKEISDLTKDNRKLTYHSLDTQIQLNNAVVQSLKAQTQINATLYAALTAQQREQDISNKEREVERAVNNLNAQRAVLSAELSHVQGDLSSSTEALNRTVDETIAMIYANRFISFLAQTKTIPMKIIPTDEMLPGATNVSAAIPFFILVEAPREGQKKSDLYDLGPMYVLAIEFSYANRDGSEFQLGAKQIATNDDRFKKFVSLMQAPGFVSPITGAGLDFAFDMKFSRPVRVVDILSRIAAKDGAIALIFFPGKVGDDTIEDTLARQFWSGATSNALANIGGWLDYARAKIDSRIKTEGDKAQFSIEFNKSELDAARDRAREKFGQLGYSHYQDRLKELDTAWLAAMRAEASYLPQYGFHLDANNHVNKFLRRFSWAASLEKQSETLFDIFDEEDDLTTATRCAAANFLEDNQLSRIPETRTELNSCRSLAEELKWMEGQVREDEKREDAAH